MSRRNQASQSQPTSSNNTASQAQGSTNQPFEVSIEKTTRNQEIWCHFDLVKFSDGSKKARYIFQSGNKRYVDYIKLCHTSNSIFLSPNWDVPTRWNSTYNMFVCGLRQKLTLQHFHDELCRKARRGENLTTVSRKRRQHHQENLNSHQHPHPNNSITYYFTNFPTNWDYKVMKDIFAKYGNVEDVFIASKRNLQGKRFGFTRFTGVINPMAFEHQLNTICIGTQRIRCNIARFQRRTSRNPEARRYTKHQPHATKIPVSPISTGTSYAGILNKSLNNPIETRKHIIDIPHPHKCNKTSIFAELKTTIGATNTHSIILDEGFEDFTIKYLGGLTLLINLPDQNAINKALSNPTLLTHFKSLVPWSNAFRIKNRVTWLAISGLPPQLWTPESFSIIANKWGDVIIPEECNPRQFNRTVGRVCILTKHLELIHKTSYVPFGSDLIPIRVSETEGEIDTLFKGGDGFLALLGQWRNIDIPCIFVVVYAPQNHLLKKKLWLDLSRLILDKNNLTVVLGDFNEVRSQTERLGTVFDPRGASYFNEFISTTGLHDLPMGAKRFTRMNNLGNKLSKIDRILVSQHAIDKWPNSNIIALPREFSDHTPILLSNSVADFGPIPFKFFNSWLLHPDFSTIVQTCWANMSIDQVHPGVYFKHKLQCLKVELKQWRAKVTKTELFALTTPATKLTN
ncbi:cytochrome P450 [Artemisia annua]|uniref:Cytochrome P450 n=1 Tax=Artemisia annua TaxID=35608 RepID=A0A2U1MPH9_ARTAN|nr:cytochrome P450 [Artemisia annua]